MGSPGDLTLSVPVASYDGKYRSLYPQGNYPLPTPTGLSAAPSSPNSITATIASLPSWVQGVEWSIREFGDASWSIISNQLAPSYVFTGLQPSITYDVRIRYRYANTYSGYSGIASATTNDVAPPPPPVAPTLSGPVRINATTLQVGISGGSGADTWTAQRRTPAGAGSFVTVGPVSIGSTTYNFTVVEGQQYDFRIVATNAGGDTNSNVVSGTTAQGDLPVANLLFDGFESGGLGSPNGPPPALNVDGFQWLSGVRTAVVQGGRIGGAYGLRFRYPPSGIDQNIAEQRFSFGSPHLELWVRWWLRVPTNYTHQSRNNKLFALWMDDYSFHGEGPTVVWELWPDGQNGTTVAIHWAEGDHNSAGIHLLSDTHFISVPADRGRWMQLVMHIKAATVRVTPINSTSTPYRISDGVVELWRRWDGDPQFAKLHTITTANIAPPPSGPLGFLNGYFLGAANMGFAEQMDFIVDEVEFSTLPLI